MSNYIAIVGKQDDKYAVAIIDSNNYTVIDRRVVRSYEIQGISNGCRPINFTINNGAVAETMGNLDRLKSKEGIQPHIVVEELATQSGRIVGYRLFNPVNNNIFSIKKEEILKRQENSAVPLLQNGIIRGNKINCYSHSNFPRFIIGTKTRTAAHKVKPIKSEVSEDSKDKVIKSDNFSIDQKRELKMAKKEGIDIRFLLNPNLTPQQMRVLWVAKKKGAYSEYFAKPEYSVEVMKFYADRLMTKKMVSDCADLLNRTDYSLDKLVELYLAVCDGIDYSSFINADTAEEMFTERERLKEELWGNSYVFSGDEVNKAVAFAKKLKNSKKV